MKYIIKFFTLLLILMGSALGHTIQVQYHLHQKEALYVIKRIEEHYKVPKSLLILKQIKKPCLQRDRDLAAILCIRDKNKELEIVSLNKKILKESYSVFKEN